MAIQSREVELAYGLLYNYAGFDKNVFRARKLLQSVIDKAAQQRGIRDTERPPPPPGSEIPFQRSGRGPRGRRILQDVSK